MSASPDTRQGDGWMEWVERRLNLSELFSFLTHFGLLYTPVDTTRPMAEVLGELRRQAMPRVFDVPRALGVVAVLAFLVEVVTGVLLAYYYQPTPDAAFGSTRTIVRDLPFGSLLHQVHAWGAVVLVVAVLARLLRLFWGALYQAPREILWWAAVAMAWLVMQMDFTGRLLVWDTHSYWEVVRGMEVIYALPLVGPLLAFLLGGPQVDAGMLIRFYVLHAMVLPLWFAACVYLTYATLRRVGLSTPSAATPGGATSYRRYLYGLAMALLVVFGILVTLAVLLPFGFTAQADPYTTPGGARPPWYMLASYTVMQALPIPTWIGGLLLLAVAFGILLLPLWLKPADEAAEKRARMAGLGLLAVWVALTVAGLYLERRS
jgi:quinol-cytochrome oxidoreductase complex cytochrome b subunit